MENIFFAMIFTTEKVRHYLLYCITYVVSLVDPLKYLVAKQHSSSRFAKCLMLLHEFDINMVKQKFFKG